MLMILTLKRFGTYLAKRGPTASQYLELFFKNARANASRIERISVVKLDVVCGCIIY